MFLDNVVEVLGHIRSLGHLPPTQLAATIGAAALICLWATWWLWRFTFLPILRPTEPLEFPYRVPYLGHAMAFYRDSHGTISRARNHFANTREPFSLTLAGQQLYVLTNPQDILLAYKETTALTFDNFIATMMQSFGTSPRAIDQMWWKAGHGLNQFAAVAPNPMGKCLAQLTRDFHKLQWHPGPQLDLIGRRFITIIHDSLEWTQVTQSNFDYDTGNSSYNTSLSAWCGTVLLEAATGAFFGDALLKLRPTLFKSFFDFDEQSWMLMYRYPRTLSKQMHCCKDEAIDGLREYFALPPEKRSDASWFVKTLETEQRQLGMADVDIASLMLQVYWVINSNTWKLCFWIMAHLLWQPSLIALIREETDPATCQNSKIDMVYLVESCPLLNSVFDEVLRLTNSSSSVRHVSSDIAVGGRLLRKGRTVLMPYRQLHFDQSVFGSEVFQFQADRFLKDPKLRRSSSYRPFGGGTTYCPGRFIARQEVLAFVSLSLRNLNLTLVSEASRFPDVEQMKPCLGVMGPVQGHDVRISIKNRSQDH